MLLKKALAIFITKFYYSFLFKSIGTRTAIYRPYLLHNAKHMSIGKGCLLRKGLRLEVVDPQSGLVISIGDNVNIEQNVHIVGRVAIIIEDDVTITGHCSIVDVVHPYNNIYSSTKIGNRISEEAFPVRIGRGSFIGFGAHISPGVEIGKYCVVGANSVVTKSMPDYSVIAGNPAKVLKIFDFESNSWVVCK